MFKEGDLVELKSGGPCMTVKEIKNKEDVVCRWFDEKYKEYKQETFKIHELKKWEDPSAEAIKTLL